jgi:hypothetical protein
MKPIDPPAMVREAEESIGQLATTIRAHLAEGAEAFRKVGQKLEKAYEHFKDPNDWEGWLQKEFGFGARQARKYRRLASEWEQVKAGAEFQNSAPNIDKMLEKLTQDAPKSEDTPKSEGLIQQRESAKTSPVTFAPTIAPAIPAPPDREPGIDNRRRRAITGKAFDIEGWTNAYGVLNRYLDKLYRLHGLLDHRDAIKRDGAYEHLARLLTEYRKAFRKRISELAVSAGAGRSSRDADSGVSQ